MEGSLYLYWYELVGNHAGTILIYIDAHRNMRRGCFVVNAEGILRIEGVKDLSCIGIRSDLYRVIKNQKNKVNCYSVSLQ